ncbi:MAG: adenine phosphoribosyltransferase [Leptospiraceae bacterium]|nr:adenine phosphoribosyltransferase [Leptospiraceae bacterium]MCB1315742.1 adenine phosphoribosyltransferase [Leptospiraceae bacterium]
MIHVDQDYLKKVIRSIPDWPEKGIIFRDITPVFSDPRALRATMDTFSHRYFDQKIDVIAGIDARGFLIGVTVAYHLNLPFVPIRKKGKLPYKTISEDYDLEYGSATIEIHSDAVQKGNRVIVFDDLIATGGTMLAGAKLVERLGGEVVEMAAIIDLPDLGGSRKIRDAGYDVHALIAYEGH